MKRTDIFIYSAVFALLTNLLPYLKDELAFILSLPFLSAGYCIYITTADILLFILNVSFFYMIMHGKFKAKRFFSFYAPKHFSFNLLFALCIITPHSVFRILNNYFELQDNRIAAFIMLTLMLLFGDICSLAGYFKALYPKDSFKEIMVKMFSFFFKNLLRFILFKLSFIFWDVIMPLFIANILYVRLGIEQPVTIISIAFTAIYTPYYTLSFKHFVKKLQ